MKLKNLITERFGDDEVIPDKDELLSIVKNTMIPDFKDLRDDLNKLKDKVTDPSKTYSQGSCGSKDEPENFKFFNLLENQFHKSIEDSMSCSRNRGEFYEISITATPHPTYIDLSAKLIEYPRGGEVIDEYSKKLTNTDNLEEYYNEIYKKCKEWMIKVWG